MAYYYPRPKQTGGRLIREVIGFLRSQNIELPITSDILIAISSGPDSMALARLLLRYGRRVVDPAKIMLLHINHGWRGKKSDEDARFVARFAKAHGVRLISRRVERPVESTKCSWEDFARSQRKRIFEEIARKRRAIVLTAHQADDLAETVLWRILTGQADTHGGGIAVRHGYELRPLLRIRKKELLLFLKEEDQGWRVDETNLAGRFLRSRIRLEILPVLENVFPRSVEHLARLGLDAQAKTARLKETLTRAANDPEFAPELLLGAAGVRGRRAHWKVIDQAHWQGTIDLPGGWRLTRELRYKRKDMNRQILDNGNSENERWVLTRS